MVKKITLSLIVVLTMALGAVAQNRQVAGIVVDESGSPIIGAAVVVVETHVGTTTGVDGDFTLNAPSDGTLEVSYLGYVSQTQPLAGKTNFEFTLKSDTQLLDDVVVVAFGTAKKEAFTGSAKVVESEDIGKVQTSSVANALVGRVSGVQTSSSSGSLGSEPAIRVRGFGSINAGNAPLWVVDGVPFSGDLNTLNTADIESMTVLKDAASNALYGSRGANGVIMVTTKKAKAGEANIVFDAKIGVNSKALKTYDVITDAGEYYQMHYDALYNARINNGASPAEAHSHASKYLTTNSYGGLGYNVFTTPDGESLIGSNGKLNPNATSGRVETVNGQDYLLKGDNWVDEAYKTGVRQEYNLSATGATDRSNFFASVGYLDNQGIIKGSSYERLTGRLKADYQAKEWAKIGANMSFTHYGSSAGNDEENQEGSSANIFAFSSRMAPIFPVYIRDGKGNIMTDKYGYQMYDYGDGASYSSKRAFLPGSNALQASWLDSDSYEGNAFTASGFADITLAKGLKLTINGGASLDEYRSTTLANPFYGQFAPTGGYVFKSHERNFNYNLQQILDYNFYVGDHNFDIMAGHEYNMVTAAALYGQKSNLFSIDNLELNGAVVDSSSSGSYTSTYNTEGYFARAQYDYKSKIYASASYRRDASSNFHPDNRWGDFWSVGGAWIISKEECFSGASSWLDMLKFKASYGSQGNDAIGALRYVDTYSLQNNDGNIAVVFNTKGNKNITWETNANFNTGIEFAMFNSRIGGNVDYFNRKTTDMLFFFPVPNSLGYSGYYDNVGDMVNSGVEIELYADIIRSENFSWTFDINASMINNKITALSAKNKTDEVDGYHGYKSGSYFYGEDLPLYTLYMPSYAGVNDETGESMWYYNEKDAKGELTGNRLTTSDYSLATQNKELQGSALADIYGGFSTSIKWGGFDASIAFTYQVGGLVYDSGYALYMSSPTSSSIGGNYHKDLYDAWTPENKKSDIPRFSYDDLYSTAQSDRFLVDASYLNISNINVGYTLPRATTQKFGVNRFRVYLACDNVAYISQRDGLDPRFSFSGATSYYNYSPIRTVSGGITIEF